MDGVRVAGLLLQAGFVRSDSLLTWGTPGYAGSASNPGVMSDVFARVGGDTDSTKQQVSVTAMVVINNGNVIVDDTWLWRADHDIGGLVYASANPVQTGLIVNGANVVGYGLACEHTLADMLVWNGEDGRTFFYQSEYPYDVTQSNYGNLGFVSYRVANGVKTHEAYGVGVYSFFRDYTVYVSNGISFSATAANFTDDNSARHVVTSAGASKLQPNTGVTFVNPLTVYLNGNGGINHVINGEGMPVNITSQLSYVC